MRDFVLHRRNDATGVSGTGTVAEGVEFADGSVAVRWRGDWRSTVVYEQGMAAVRHIHGHGGATSPVVPEELTVVRWRDEVAVLACADCPWVYELVPGCSVQGVREMAFAHYVNGHLT